MLQRTGHATDGFARPDGFFRVSRPLNRSCGIVEGSIAVEVAYWQPRVLRHPLPDGSAEYAIHEVYFAKDGSVVTCTEDALSARRRSVADLESWIQFVLSEGAGKVVCGDLGYSYDEEDLGLWLKHVHDPPIDYD